MTAVPLLIFPYNGNALEAVDCLGSRFVLVGYIDDALDKRRAEVGHDHPVFGRDAFARFPDAMVLAVPGSPESFTERRRIIVELGIPDDRFATVVHPSANVSERAVVGKNTLLMAGVVVSNSAVVGSNVCILPSTVIHHHAIVGDWTLIGSNVTVAGGVVLEENCYIGSGSSIMNGVHIGRGSLVGLGSNVIRNVDAHKRVAGNPAREVKRRPKMDEKRSCP